MRPVERGLTPRRPAGSLVLLFLVCGLAALASCMGNGGGDENSLDLVNGGNGRISSADLTESVPAPKPGSFPKPNLSVLEYSGSVVWRETDAGEGGGSFTGPFQANKSYTATVTLIPAPGKNFGENVPVKHTWASPESKTFTGGAGGNVSGTITFPPYIPFSGTSSVDGDSVIDLIKEAAANGSPLFEIKLRPGTDKVRLDEGDINGGLLLYSGASPTEVVIDGGGRTVDLTGQPAGKALITVGSVGLGGTLTLRNITFKGLNSTDDGGIDNNYALIAITGGGHLILENGAAIKDNTSTGGYTSGGVLMAIDDDNAPAPYPSFTMNGGEISGNKGYGYGNGGGVLINSGKSTNVYSYFNMNGGVISGNTTDYSGGGVLTYDNVEMTMTGGVISGNTANDIFYSANGGGKGGGIHLERFTEFTMKGGVISGNKALNGGGVAVAQESRFEMNGGVISGNTADVFGGGVYGHTAIGGKTFPVRFTKETASGSNDSGVIYGYTASDPLSNKAGTGASGYGHAVFIGTISVPNTLMGRDSTADGSVTLSSGTPGTPGNWDY